MSHVPIPAPAPGLAVATLGGGCFWCLEAVFEWVEGIHAVESGFSGGHVEHPTYEQVCDKKTGHAEVVQVVFDPAVLPYRDLLEIFLAAHDPTQLDRQGNDVGPQYRSAIFTHDEEQDRIARALIAEHDAAGTFGGRIVTQVAPFERFWPAEAYHRRYYRRNPLQPYCAFVISPKVGKLRQKHAGRLRAAPVD